MKLAVLTIGEDTLPSTRFRILQYLPRLRASGLVVDCYTLPPTRGGRLERLLGLFRQAWVRWRQFRKVSHYNLVLIQKGLTPWRCRGFVKRLMATGVPYLLDLDDAVHLMPPLRLPFYLRWLQEEREPLRLAEHARQIIVGNRFLADSLNGQSRKTALIPTPIDTQLYKRRSGEGGQREKIVIGWSGSTSTNFYVNTLIPVLNRLAQKYSFEFLVISNDLSNIEKEKFQGFSFRFLPWRPESEVKDLQEIDIGVMPLWEDEWSRGKCGLKALQYMALGLPAVCSPVGVNEEIIQDGVNGFFARNEEEWEGKLSRLIQSENLRMEMGAAARKTVEEKYSVDANFPKLMKVLEEVSR